MLSYYLKCRKNTESKNAEFVKKKKKKNGRTMIFSTCVVCGSKKSKFS